MDNLPLNKDLKKQISLVYLQKIIDKIKNNEMDENDFDKILKIIFENASNCNVDFCDKDNKEILLIYFH